MNILEVSNHVIIAEAFAKEFLRLEGENLANALREVYNGAVTDSRTDDSKLREVLDGQTMGEYAVLVGTFKKALMCLEDVKGEIGDSVFSTKAFIPLFQIWPRGGRCYLPSTQSMVQPYAKLSCKSFRKMLECLHSSVFYL